MRTLIAALILAACSTDAPVSAGGDPAVGGDVTLTAPDASEPEPVDFEIPEDTLRTSYFIANSYSFGSVKAASLIAAFYDQSPNPLNGTSETVGACEVRTHRFDGPDGGFPKYKNAGKLTLSGGAFPLSLALGPGGYSAVSDSEKALFEGGETLTFAAVGASDVPAFSVDLVAPSHVTVTAPVIIPGQKLELDKTTPFTLEWSGESAGQIEVVLSGPQQLPEPQTTIICRFDVAAGAAEIPVEALAKVALSGTGTMSVNAVSRVDHVAEGWGPVKIQADIAALKSSGAQFLPSVIWPSVPLAAGGDPQ